MRTLFRVLAVAVLVLVLAVGAVLGYGIHLTRASFPQVSGEVAVEGLIAPVTVMRNDLGIPQIYADNLEDLFYAQGYVHAQDRFWEMDVRRHITSGRLSEMFGAGQVTTDSFLRTMGWRRIAEQEVGMLSERSGRILDAYSAGVNAYLADHSGQALSLEYAVLGLQNSEYQPEPWQPADSVAWLKALAWDLRGNMTDEVYRSVMSASVGVEHTEELFPPYPYAQHRPIVEIGAVVDGVFDQTARPTPGSAGSSVPVQVTEDMLPALRRVEAATASLTRWLGPTGPGIGSNSWAVNGDRSSTGKPLLANDPHLAPSMPSLWYQSGLKCTTLTDDCNYDVTGWTMAGLPGVFIGHNDTIAWGFTNLGPDVTDLVLEQVNGDESLRDGQLVAMTTRPEVIKVAGGDPVTITVRETANGPIISDVAGIEDYVAVGEDAPVPAPGTSSSLLQAPSRGKGYAVSLRWTALTPAPTFDAFDLLNTARSWSQFRKAGESLAVPAQNLLYADVNGNIGYQAPGAIPVREGYDGKWPVPGWDSRYRWNGTVPFAALPSVLNPPQGWIVTANQAVIGPNYPYFLTDDWAYGSRSQRIVDLITAATADGAKVSPEQLRQIQMDSWNELAAFLAPKLLALPTTDQTAEAVALLKDWDFTQPTDSAPAAFFNAVWRHMVTRMFDSAADTDLIYASGGDRYWQVVEDIWADPNDFWWDDRTAGGTQSRDETLQASIVAAVQELSDLQGSNPADWTWGGLHTLELTNQTLGKSGIAPIEWLFNRGPLEVAGGEAIVNATGWTPKNGYVVDWVPSMRQVVDLANFDNSTWVNLTGASGHAFNPHYVDQAESWRTGEQYPWAFSRNAIEESTADVLTLAPTSS